MTQNIIFVVALFGALWRLWTRRMTRPEWCVLALVAVSVLLVQLQMYVGEQGKLQWILRYHQASLTLLYGWAAWTAAELIRVLSGRRRALTVGVVALWLVSTGGTSLWRIVKHHFAGSRRNAWNEAAVWAAGRIAEDWKGPRVDEERFFTVQEYHPRLRPIIHSMGARLPWLAKGRWYSLSPDVRRHEKPDYAFLPASIALKRPPSGMTEIDSAVFGKKKIRFILYRKNGAKK